MNPDTDRHWKPHCCERVCLDAFLARAETASRVEQLERDEE